MVVRFEVDACLSDTPSRLSKNVGIDDLVASLSATRLSSNPAGPLENASSSPTNLIIQRAGTLIPQSRVVELATRAEHNISTYDWSETYPQLALSQTPHHILGAHQRGTFTNIFQRTLKGPGLAGAALAAREGLIKLRAVLDAVQELAVEYGKKNGLSLVCKDGQLMAYEREGSKGCLPEEYLKRFDA
jgi:hypothetical protein